MRGNPNRPLMGLQDFAHYDGLGNKIALAGRAQQDRDLEFRDTMPLDRPLQNVLPNHEWDPWLQAMKEQGVEKLVGGQSPPGSNLMTGVPSDPWYIDKESKPPLRPRYLQQLTSLIPGSR